MQGVNHDSTRRTNVEGVIGRSGTQRIVGAAVDGQHGKRKGEGEREGRGGGRGGG